MSNPKNNKTRKPNKGTGEASVKPRNPAATNPLMKKSHAHERRDKVARQQSKQNLRRQLLDDNA